MLQSFVWANRAWGSGKMQLPRWLQEHLGVTWGDCREPGVPRSNSVLMLPLSLLNVPPDLGLDFVFFFVSSFLNFQGGTKLLCMFSKYTVEN